MIADQINWTGNDRGLRAMVPKMAPRVSARNDEPRIDGRQPMQDTVRRAKPAER